MKKFYSLSQYPGKTGETFYNRLFHKLGLDYTYTALECHNLKEGIATVRNLGCAGFSVSMPFKKEMARLIDATDINVVQFGLCNTVLIRHNQMYGSNTDYYGAIHIAEICRERTVSILGDGAMGSMFQKIIGDNARVYSRKLGNWENRYEKHDVIINCTSFGTANTDSPFGSLPVCNLIFDLSMKSNQLKEQCDSSGVKYIDGLLFYKHQFINQFKIYTGIEINIDMLDDI